MIGHKDLISRVKLYIISECQVDQTLVTRVKGQTDMWKVWHILLQIYV